MPRWQNLDNPREEKFIRGYSIYPTGGCGEFPWYHRFLDGFGSSLKKDIARTSISMLRMSSSVYGSAVCGLKGSGARYWRQALVHFFGIGLALKVLPVRGFTGAGSLSQSKVQQPSGPAPCPMTLNWHWVANPVFSASRSASRPRLLTPRESKAPIFARILVTPESTPERSRKSSKEE